MDRYEYNLKLEEIDKLVDQRDYDEAAKLADTIDWKRVRNVRTLCLVSEIYEAAGRPEDSKTLLERAYRRSPVGRTVLYRLVEVTISLHQYDEALEYYTEYTNVAPNDTNHLILKYRIYRGRGASPEELIPILEEYASLEYTEQWTYELARLYQQAGQIQKCLAMCDDLVLWFHSGKYVLKALELKKKYAKLTPKQEEIYNEQFVRPAEVPVKEEQPEKTEDMLTTVAGEVNSEVIAATIIASTEKEIAGEVAAHKAELEQAELAQAEPGQMEPVQPKEEGIQPARPEDMDEDERSQEEMNLQVELARSMREIIAGVVKRAELPEETNMPEEPVIPKKLQSIPEVEPEIEPTAGRLSIDDILLSMGEKGRELARKAQAVQEAQAAEPEKTEKSAVEETKEDAGQDFDGQEKTSPDEKSLPAYEERSGKEPRRIRRLNAKEEEEILKEKTIRVPTDKIARLHARYGIEELWDEQARWMTREPEEKPQFSGSGAEEEIYEPETDLFYEEIEVSDAAAYDGAEEAGQYGPADADEIYDAEESREYVPADSDEIYEEAEEGREYVPADSDEIYDAAEEEAESIPADSGEIYDAAEEEAESISANSGGIHDAAEEDVRSISADSKEAYDLKEEESGRDSKEQKEEIYDMPADSVTEYEPESEGALDTAEEDSDAENAGESGVYEEADGGEPEAQEREDSGEGDGERVVPAKEGPLLPDHLREFFRGFTKIEGLEQQIANAVFQAVANSGDRTSRTGNILIFGPHGSGKTTLAMNIARAAAQERGSDTLKVAKIYAADFNRKDIAATVAKIAGGTLIIEEAGDLDTNAIEQLTTAMEFRTDGMMVILEDEQQYIHDLLMSNPRFTMKFTAQIYLPVYTAQELIMFAQLYTEGQDYVISEEGKEVLYAKISAAAEQGNNVSIANMVELVNHAIHRSNKLLRRMAMGKKRYDENDFIVLYAKDFR